MPDNAMRPKEAWGTLLIVITKKKAHFLAALKDKRLEALSEAGKEKERFVRAETLRLPDTQDQFLNSIAGQVQSYL